MTYAEARRYAQDPLAAQRDAQRVLEKHQRDAKARASRARVKTPHRAAKLANERKEAERQKKRERRVAVRAAVMQRGNGKCEACGDVEPPYELDHFWGRAREESVESCWALCATCHHEKTRNEPSRGDWLDWFRCHCSMRGYHAQLEKCDRALALENAQHPERSTP